MNRLLLVLGLLCFIQSIYAQQKVTKSEKSECEKMREKAQKSNSKVNLIPNCELNGDFSGLQCHPENKFCQCWTPDGNIITSPSTKIKACDCFREKHKSDVLSSSNGRPVAPPVGMFIPKCNKNGTYESKQCHGSTGMCWCAEESGKQIGDKIRGPLTCP